VGVEGIVASLGHQRGAGTIGDIDNGECVFVEAEADLAAGVGGVGSVVDHALGVVHVTVVSEAADKHGVAGVGDIDDVETSTAGRVGALYTYTMTSELLNTNDVTSQLVQ
jgi:hypothetical protein